MANIVHFGKYYFPDAGGIESVTVSLAKGATMAGHTVSVVCFEKTPSNGKEVIDGVEIIRAPIEKLLASQPLGFKYFWKCLSAARTANIVHLHAPNMLGALCSLFIPVKTQLLVHWHSDVINKGLIGQVLRPLEFLLLHRANSIVVTSQVYADASKTLASFRKKINVVPIGVPDKKHEDNNSQLPPKLEEQIGNRKIILAVGRLVPYKGFNVLIKASQQLIHDSVVVIVGSGPLQQELQQNINNEGLMNRVVLAGRLSDAVLHKLFKRATLYCLPSTYRSEAFGVVLLEAMAYGLPVVASNIPGSGVPWVNKHGLSGLNVPVGDVKAFADAFNKVLSSEVLHRKLSHGARQRFLAKFTEDASIKRMLLIYDGLLSKTT